MPAITVRSSDATNDVQRTAPASPLTYTHNSAATTNATLVKSGESALMALAVSNVNAAARYLKLYNKATAPTVGTDRPVLTIPIPATGIANIQFGCMGLLFTLGLCFALTTGAADADTAAVAANEQKVVLSYI